MYVWIHTDRMLNVTVSKCVIIFSPIIQRKHLQHIIYPKCHMSSLVLNDPGCFPLVSEKYVK